MVEDSAPLSAVYQAYLKHEAVTLISVASGVEALQQLPLLRPDIFASGSASARYVRDGILKHVQASALGISTIVMTANGSLDMAVDATRLGTHDFIAKPVDADRLRVTLRTIPSSIAV